MAHTLESDLAMVSLAVSQKGSVLNFLMVIYSPNLTFKICVNICPWTLSGS